MISASHELANVRVRDRERVIKHRYERRSFRRLRAAAADACNCKLHRIQLHTEVLFVDVSAGVNVVRL